MEIFIVVGSLIVGFSFGWNLRERVAVIKAKKLMAELEQLEDEEHSEEVVRITIEKDSDTLFAYHKDSSQFITQAPNRAELEKKLSELFPGKKFGVTPQNLIEIGFTS
jgi:hypothetical protein